MYEIAAFGNPLLDIIVNIDSDDLLKKYDIKNDDQKEIDDSQMKNLYKDIEKHPKKLNPGGCAQNTVRIMQWILHKPNSTVFFGMISNDEQGSELRKLVNNDNVITKYQVDEEHITGMCVGLVSEEYRALLANISAAQYFSKTKLDAESLEMLRNTKMIYVEACFLPFRNEVSKFIQEFCVEHDKPLVFNLSAVYLFDMEPDMIRYYAEKSNILFGNRNEFKALGKLIGMDDIEKIAIDLNRNYIGDRTGLRRFGKVVVVTNGAKDIKCVYGDRVVVNVDVRKAKFVVDTVSAGDAFVAGFLVGLLKGYDIEKCIDWGQTAAIEIIQQPGSTIPKYDADKVFYRTT